jgi:hypothetical protein
MEQTRQVPEVTSSAVGKQAAGPIRSRVAGCHTPNAARLPTSHKAQRGATAPTVGPSPPRGASPATGRKPPRAGRTAASPFGAAVVAARARPPSATKKERPLRAASGSGQGATGSSSSTTRRRRDGLRRLTAASSTGGRARPQSPHKRGRRPRHCLPRGRAGSRRPAQAAAWQRAWEVVVASRVSGEAACHPRGGDEPENRTLTNNIRVVSDSDDQ